MLACLELAARVAKLVKAWLSPPIAASASEAILRKQDWFKQYQIDSAGELGRYMTYVGFREKPQTSTTVNIDAKGRRRVPGGCEKDDAITVMTFGGSTMYGAGVPDQFTIPAYLAGVFNREGRCVKVINYGSSWWQSSQSLIQLI